MEVAPRPKNVNSRNDFGEILGTKLFFGRKYGDEKKLVKKRHVKIRYMDTLVNQFFIEITISIGPTEDKYYTKFDQTINYKLKLLLI